MMNSCALARACTQTHTKCMHTKKHMHTPKKGKMTRPPACVNSHSNLIADQEVGGGSPPKDARENLENRCGNLRSIFFPRPG